jgi:GAF domain-containing protein
MYPNVTVLTHTRSGADKPRETVATSYPGDELPTALERTAERDDGQCSSLASPAMRSGEHMEGADVEIVGDVRWSVLEGLGRALHVKEADLATTLNAIVISAAETIDGTSYAGVNLLVRGRFAPQATAGGPPPVLDEFQERTSEGPCVDASRDQVTVRIANMEQEHRWPKFAELAVSLGVLSMLCVPLWVDETRVGSLSLYGLAYGTFTPQHERLASLFATHAALALADAQRTEQLRLALANRDVIGVAKGVLMERHRVTVDAAFELLSSASQRVNRKLVVVAQDLVDTGELP